MFSEVLHCKHKITAFSGMRSSIYKDAHCFCLQSWLLFVLGFLFVLFILPLSLYSDHISVSSYMLLFCLRLLDILSQFQSTTMPLNLVRGMHSVLLWGVKMWGLNPLLADMPSVFFQYLWHCSLVWLDLGTSTTFSSLGFIRLDPSINTQTYEWLNHGFNISLQMN